MPHNDLSSSRAAPRIGSSQQHFRNTSQHLRAIDTEDVSHYDGFDIQEDTPANHYQSDMQANTLNKEEHFSSDFGLVALGTIMLTVLVAWGFRRRQKLTTYQIEMRRLYVNQQKFLMLAAQHAGRTYNVLLEFASMEISSADVDEEQANFRWLWSNMCAASRCTWKCVKDAWKWVKNTSGDVIESIKDSSFWQQNRLR